MTTNIQMKQGKLRILITNMRLDFFLWIYLHWSIWILLTCGVKHQYDNLNLG